MSTTELREFEILETFREDAECTRALAQHPDHQSPVQLIVFASRLSANPDFRRAIKTDRSMLEMLRHQGLVNLLGVSESDGTLFCWTEHCDFPTLAQQLANDNPWSTDDIIEIGWQICSALQQAHNLGIVHEFLAADLIQISDSLRVCIADLGIARWLHLAVSTETPASEFAQNTPALITISVLASRAAVENDLCDLARILLQLLNRNDDQQPAGAGLRALLQRILDADQPQIPVTAREFQGRLGELLLGTEQQEIPIVDERDSVAGSRRSIVVELFEHEQPPHSQPRNGIPADSAPRLHNLPVLALLALAAIITIIAVAVF